MGYRVHCGCIHWVKPTAKVKGVGYISTRPPRPDSWKKAMEHLFKAYKNSATKRGYGFDLSIEVFQSISQKNCSYCGQTPSQSHKVGSNLPFVYNGIDRKNNALGYTPENSIPCCGTCNKMKSALGYDEFLAHVKRICSHLLSSM